MIGVGIGCDGAIPPNLREISEPVLGWPEHPVLYLSDHLNSPVALADASGAATHETPRQLDQTLAGR
jgi:hypothetical protein